MRATEREMSVWSVEMSANLQDMSWKLKCNPTECNVIHVRKGKQVEHAANLGLKLDETTLVEKLKTETKYKFLGLRESVMEDEKISTYSCSKDVLAKALNNLDKPSVRRQPCQGNKPVRLPCVNIPHVDPTMAIGRAGKH